MNDFAIITTTDSGAQLCASGYRKMDSVLRHIRERIELSKASPYAEKIRGFVVVNSFGSVVQFHADGEVCDRARWQSWYANEEV